MATSDESVAGDEDEIQRDEELLNRLLPLFKACLPLALQYQRERRRAYGPEAGDRFQMVDGGDTLYECPPGVLFLTAHGFEHEDRKGNVRRLTTREVVREWNMADMFNGGICPLLRELEDHIDAMGRFSERLGLTKENAA